MAAETSSQLVGFQSMPRWFIPTVFHRYSAHSEPREEMKAIFFISLIGGAIGLIVATASLSERHNTSHIILSAGFGAGVANVLNGVMSIGSSEAIRTTPQLVAMSTSIMMIVVTVFASVFGSANGIAIDITGGMTIPWLGVVALIVGHA